MKCSEIICIHMYVRNIHSILSITFRVARVATQMRAFASLCHRDLSMCSPWTWTAAVNSQEWLARQCHLPTQLCVCIYVYVYVRPFHTDSQDSTLFPHNCVCVYMYMHMYIYTWPFPTDPQDSTLFPHSCVYVYIYIYMYVCICGHLPMQMHYSNTSAGGYVTK